MMNTSPCEEGREVYESYTTPKVTYLSLVEKYPHICIKYKKL